MAGGESAAENGTGLRATKDGVAVTSPRRLTNGEGYEPPIDLPKAVHQATYDSGRSTTRRR